MTGLRFSFIFLFVLGFLCLANGNPISNFFGKSSDDKAEADDKTTVSTAPTVKSAGETTTTTTTTPEPSSSCGGLKGFLHICDKNAPTEPPKSVKTRSASEEDDDSDEDEDDDSDSDDDDDDDDSNEKTNVGEKKQEPTETSPVSSEPTEGGIAKRQVGDPEAPVLGEIPPVVADAMGLPTKPEEDGDVEKRQVDESDSDSDEDDQNSDENIKYSRQRRDCRDREGDYGKDCRKKREFVPTCFGSNCKRNETTEPNK